MAILKKLNLSIYFWIGLTITLSLLWPLVAAPYFTHHDDVQVIRLFEMNKCIQDFQIPCRWVPDLGGLYGYPIFNFYAPLPYYIAEIFYLIGHNLIAAAKIIFAIPLVGSFIFMYLLARKAWGEKGGVLSAIFYSLAPYHAVVFYVRGAMGEIWALMFFPAVLWALMRLKEKTNLNNSLLLGILISLLVLSHNLSTMLFLPISLVFAGVLFLQQKDIKFIKFLSFSVFLGLLLSAFYLAPMMFEKNLVHVDSTIGGYFSYTEHFKGLRKLIIERTWGWGASVREIPGGEKDGMSFQIGWIHLFGWFLSLVAAAFLWSKSRKSSILIVFSSIIILLSIFMINPKSEFAWKLLDPLKYLQFPWRLLMIIIFFISFISGSIPLVLKDNYQKVVWGILVIAVIFANFSYFRPEKFLQIDERSFLTGIGWDRQIKRSIFDFLPIFAKAPPAELATVDYEIVKGEAKVSNFAKGSNWITLEVDSVNSSTIKLSQYYFPGWKILIDGKETNIDYKSNDLGLMTITIEGGHHLVQAKLYNTPIRNFGNLATIFGICLSIFLFLKGRKTVV